MNTLVKQSCDILSQLDKKPSKDDLVEIKSFLEKCCDLYYAPEENEDTPLTDEEYDNIVKYYDKYSKERFITGSSKTAGNKKLVNLDHKFPDLVGTLYKAFTVYEVRKWLEVKLNSLERFPNDISFVVSLKYDGNSAVGIYNKNGKCTEALTRGKKGQGMSLYNIFETNSIKNPNNDETGIKYEVITTTSDLNKISEKRGKSYVNARSVVAGLLSADDGAEFTEFLTFVPLKIESTNTQIDRKDQLEMLNSITKTNNTIPFTYKTFEYKNKKTINDLLDSFCEDLTEMYTEYIDLRLSMSYMIDGLVIEILNEDIREKLGRTNFENNFEIALKFPSMVHKSVITGMRFDTGKSNRITPVAIFEPVYFNGAKCEHVSLSNYKRFKELKLAIGDEVSIEYHGDVLSYLNKVPGGESGNKPIKFISHCPDCKEKLKVTINDKGEKIFVYCPNKKCPSGKKGKILNYIKKMDIKGIDQSIVNDLFANGLIRGIQHLYRLNKEDILDIEGYKEKSADNIINAINSRKEVYDYEMLGSLMINNFGRDSAKLLLQEISLDDILYEIENDNIESLKYRIVNLKGFSDKSADYIVKGIRSNFKLINFLVKELKLKSIKEEIENKKKELNISADGPKYKVVVTGDLNHWSRPEFKSIIEMLGHKLIGSISGKTDYLITNDTTSGTVKNKQAKEKGIPIIDEEEAIKVLGLESFINK